VRDTSLISMQVLQSDGSATVVRKSQVRALIAAVAVGVLITLQLVAAAERMSARRKRRRMHRIGDHRSADPDGPLEFGGSRVAAEPCVSQDRESPDVGAPATGPGESTPGGAIEPGLTSGVGSHSAKRAALTPST